MQPAPTSVIEERGHRVAVAAKRLGIGKRTAERYIAKGLIRAVKIGCATVVPESEILRLLRVAG